MKNFLKRITPNLGFLLVVGMILGLALPLMPARPVQAAIPDDYDYVQEINITGTTAGAQTNYTMELHLSYEIGKDYPQSFTMVGWWDGMFPEEGTHIQGAVIEDGFIWVSSSDIIIKTYSDVPDFDNPLATNDHANTDGTDCVQINELDVWGNYIIATAPLTDTNKFMVKWYNKSDLVFVDELGPIALPAGSTYAEGCSWYDNSWWVPAHYGLTISRYSSSWAHIEDFSVTVYDRQPYPQGAFWSGDYYWLTCDLASYPDAVQMYYWDGNNLVFQEEVYTSDLSAGSNGGGRDPTLNYMWMTALGRYDEEPHSDGIFKYLINYSGEIHLEGNCQTDFDDVVFTESDGTTLIPYWRESYNLGINATFHVEFPTIPASPNSVIYRMYYGNDSASYGGDGEDVGLFFEDFLGSSINTGVWSGDTGSASVSGSVCNLTSIGDTAVNINSTQEGSFGPGINCKMLISCPDIDAGGDHSASFGLRTGGSNFNLIATVHTTGDYWKWMVMEEDSYEAGATNVTISSDWITHEILWKDTNVSRFNIQGTGWTTNLVDVPGTAIPVYFGSTSYAAGKQTSTYIDWILVTKHVEPEPTMVFSLQLYQPPQVISPDLVTIGSSTSTLLGNIWDTGASSVTKIRWEWGLTDSYGNTWEETGTYGLGIHSHPITGLTGGTVYHFRFSAYNSYGWGVGLDNTFTTTGVPVVPGAPTNLVLSTNVTQVEAEWDTGAGASKTLLRYSTDTHPTTITMGIEGYFGSAESITLTAGLAEGQTCFVSLWGEANGVYSTTYTTDSIKVGVSPPAAISNVMVFSDFLEDGDQLYVFSYEILVSEEYWTQTPQNYFHMQLAVNETVVAQGKLPAWGKKPGSIYLNADEALPWGTAQTEIKITGITGTDFAGDTVEYALQSSSWVGQDLTQLEDWVIALAHDLEEYYDVTLVEATGKKGVYLEGEVQELILGEKEQLSAGGTAIFVIGIPGLVSVLPDLFEGIVVIPEDAVVPPVPTYQDTLIGNAGQRLVDAFADIGNALGVSGEFLSGGFWFWIVVLSIQLVGLGVGRPDIGLICAQPIIFVGVWMGVIPLVWILLPIFLLASFVYAKWFRVI